MSDKQVDQYPNIVLIVLDSVRQDHLSSYGYFRQTTPHIDRLAEDGIRFENAYSTSCWTIPAHASLFTGLYPSQHGADLDGWSLPDEHTTLAEYLKSLGYATACISCNSFVAGGAAGLNRGFDFTHDVESAGPKGRSLPAKALRFARKSWRRFTSRDRGTGRAVESASRWVREQSRPFFLFMNLMDCHLPYRLARPERYRFIPPVERKRIDRIPLDPFAAMAGELQLSTRDVAGQRALYDGCLFYMDQQVGSLLDFFKQLGIFDQTIFLVTSDHGESFGEHGLFDHQYGLFNHMVRVPLIARFPRGSQNGPPSGQPARTLIQHPIQLVDLFPLLARTLASPGRGFAPGDVSFLESPLRNVLLFEYLSPNLRAIQRRFPGVDVSRFNVPLRAVQKDGYKLIYRENGQLELYDLEKDPGEQVNLARARPELASRMQDILFSLLDLGPSNAVAHLPSGLDEDLRERLEALGYL
jgi:arylsulfatase A-like enzyme